MVSLMYDVEWEKNHQMLEEMRFNSKGRRITLDKLTESEIKHFRELQEFENNLGALLRSSIIACSQCGRLEGDRYYNQYSGHWYCLECVEEIRKGHAKIMAKKAAGTYTCDDDNGFGNTFL